MMDKLLLLLMVAFVTIGVFTYTFLVLSNFKNNSMVTQLLMMLHSACCIGFTLIGGKLLYNIVTFTPDDNPTLRLITYAGAGIIYILITRLLGTALKRNLLHYQLE